MVHLQIEFTLLKIGVNMSIIIVEVPARGTVHVYGASVSNQETQNIETTVKGVSGVSKVVSGLAVLRGV
jgi:osmotically-inducible protein OsmY